MVQTLLIGKWVVLTGRILLYTGMYCSITVVVYFMSVIKFCDYYFSYSFVKDITSHHIILFLCFISDCIRLLLLVLFHSLFNPDKYSAQVII